MVSPLRYRIVDVFTERPLEGNPLCVVLDPCSGGCRGWPPVSTSKASQRRFLRQADLGHLGILQQELDRTEPDDLVRNLVHHARELAPRQDRSARAQQIQRLLADAHPRSFDLLRTANDRRRLLARLVQAQEEERQRIASDIHDDTIQKMTAVGMRVETLRRRIDEPQALRSIEQLQETVQLSIGRLRHLMFELRPPSLDREGLAAALRQHLSELASKRA